MGNMALELPNNIGKIDDDGILVMKRQRRDLKGMAKWKDIGDLINRWAKRQPQRAYQLEQDLKFAQLEAKVTGGKWEKTLRKDGAYHGDMKVGILIDPELMNYIQVFYPEFLDTKEELQEFKRYFPKFCIVKPKSTTVI